MTTSAYSVPGGGFVWEADMNLVSLTLGGVVAGLVAKSVDVLSDRLVTGAANTLGRLVDRLRAQFDSHGDAEATRVLDELQAVPDSPSRLKIFADTVDGHLRDMGFRADLEGLVAELGAAGANVEQLVQSAWGNHITQIGSVRDSEVNVTYGRPTGAPAGG
jgi:hypothetical protein